MITWTMGPITKVERAGLVQAGAILPPTIERRATGFETDLDASEHYQAVLTELTEDPERCRRIAHDAAWHAQQNGELVVVLSDRRAHCRTIADLARGYLEDPAGAIVLTGKQKAADKRRGETAIQDGAARVICATVQLIGEGWDLPQASTLILATPIKFSGRLVQAIGRVLRPAPGKDQATVIDYVDDQVPVLRASGWARARVYRELVGEKKQAAPLPSPPQGRLF